MKALVLALLFTIPLKFEKNESQSIYILYILIPKFIKKKNILIPKTNHLIRTLIEHIKVNLRVK